MILGWYSDGNHGKYWWNMMKIRCPSNGLYSTEELPQTIWARVTTPFWAMPKLTRFFLAPLIHNQVLCTSVCCCGVFSLIQESLTHSLAFLARKNRFWPNSCRPLKPYICGVRFYPSELHHGLTVNLPPCHGCWSFLLWLLLNLFTFVCQHWINQGMTVSAWK